MKRILDWLLMELNERWRLFQQSGNAYNARDRWKRLQRRTTASPAYVAVFCFAFLAGQSVRCSGCWQVSHFLNWSPPPKPSRPCFYLPTWTGLREWRKWIWSRPTRSCRWLRLTTIDHGNTGNAAGLFFATFFFLDGGACLFFNTAAWNTMETWGGHNTRILQQPHRVDAVEWSRRPLEAKQAPCANGLQSAGRAQIKKGKNRSLLQRHLAAVITFSR